MAQKTITLATKEDISELKAGAASALWKKLTAVTAARMDDVPPLPHTLKWTQYGVCDQAGTPTPSAPVAITGRAAGSKACWKNILPPFGNSAWKIGNSADWMCVMSSSQPATFPFTYSANQYNSLPVIPIEVKPNTTYTIGYCPTQYIVCTEYARISDISNTGKSIRSTSPYTRAPYTFTTSANTSVVMIGFSNWQNSNVVTVDANTVIQLEIGSTATAYEPYVAEVDMTAKDAGGNDITLYGIPVSSGGNVTIGTQQYIADTLEQDGTVTRRVGYLASYAGETVSTAYISTTGALSTGASVYYVLTTPTTETATLTNDSPAANSPTTTWISTAPSDVTYNRDLVAAYNELAAAIVALGGTI